MFKGEMEWNPPNNAQKVVMARLSLPMWQFFPGSVQVERLEVETEAAEAAERVHRAFCDAEDAKWAKMPEGLQKKQRAKALKVERAAYERQAQVAQELRAGYTRQLEATGIEGARLSRRFPKVSPLAASEDLAVMFGLTYTGPGHHTLSQSHDMGRYRAQLERDAKALLAGGRAPTSLPSKSLLGPTRIVCKEATPPTLTPALSPLGPGPVGLGVRPEPKDPGAVEIAAAEPLPE
jgi:hypothetical protein